MTRTRRVKAEAMKISVNECMKLDVFKGARLAAGGAGLSNKVRNVAVLEPATAAEITKYKPEEGCMVLSGFFGMRDDTELQCRAVRAVAASGAAGGRLEGAAEVTWREGRSHSDRIRDGKEGPAEVMRGPR